MSYGPLIAAEVPVLTVVVAGTVGFLLRRAIDRVTATLTQHGSALATQSQALAVMVERQKPVDIALRDLQVLTASQGGKLSNLEQTTAVLAATLEEHKDHHPGPYRART
jgi:hypothetical protein